MGSGHLKRNVFTYSLGYRGEIEKQIALFSFPVVRSEK